jgi:hypothetical protein
LYFIGALFSVMPLIKIPRISKWVDLSLDIILSIIKP